MLKRQVVRSPARREPRINPHSGRPAGLPLDGRLRLLSFNIQVGITTQRYHHYLTRSWQHLLPHAGRGVNLRRIGELLADYDLVALQERSEEHTSELQSRENLVCRLLLE